MIGDWRVEISDLRLVASASSGEQICNRRSSICDLQSITPSSPVPCKSIHATVMLCLGAFFGVAPLHAQAVDLKLVESVGWYTGTAVRVDNALAKELLLEAAEDGDPSSRMWIERV